MTFARPTTRIVITAALVCSFGAGLLGCSAPGSDEPATEAPAEDSMAAAFDSGEEIFEALEMQYGTEPWFEYVDSVELRQELLADVAYVETTLETGASDAYDTAMAIAEATVSATGELVPNARVVSADGPVMAGTSSGQLAVDALQLPSPPSDPVALMTWLDSVFGDSGEAWHTHVTGIALSDQVPGWDGTPVLLVSTDLQGGQSPENQHTADLIGGAIHMSGQTISSSYAVQDASGAPIMSGDVPVFSYGY